MRLPNKVLDKYYIGDNLSFMEHLPDGCVDLIYADPPFYTKKRRTTRATFNAIGTTSFSDMFGSVDAYFDFLFTRLDSCLRVLSDTGTLWIHLDDIIGFAVSYRLLLDKRYKLVNNIVLRRRKSAPRTHRKLGSVWDLILVYAKKADYTFNQIYGGPQSLSAGTVEKYKYEDESGRYCLSNITVSNNMNKGYRYTVNGYDREWWYSKERMRELHMMGVVVPHPNTGLPVKKIYLHESKGLYLSNLWQDGEFIMNRNKERTGYPTEKKVSLLRRIVQLGSNPGDVVFDPFAGSGTTLVAAEAEGRRYLGIDKNLDGRRAWLMKRKKYQEVQTCT